MRFAIIHNAQSLRNRQGGAHFARMAGKLLGPDFVSSVHDGSITEHIRSFCARGVDTVVIDGGDGTVSTCLTAIAEVYPSDSLPDVVVLASGNTNLIAGDVGFGLRGVKALKRLLQGGELRSSTRSPITLSWPGTGRKPVMGMFGGCAGYARAVRIAHSPTVLRYAPHDLAVGLTILSSIASLLLRSSRMKWLNGDALDWESHSEAGRQHHGGRSFLFMVTGLARLSQGIWPFWHRPQETDGIRFLNIRAFPKKLPSALLCLLCGRKPKWLREHPDYMSGRAVEITLRTEGEFVLDGEVFPTSGDLPLTLKQGPLFRFLHA